MAKLLKTDMEHAFTNGIITIEKTWIGYRVSYKAFMCKRRSRWFLRKQAAEDAFNSLRALTTLCR